MDLPPWSSLTIPVNKTEVGASRYRTKPWVCLTLQQSISPLLDSPLPLTYVYITLALTQQKPRLRIYLPPYPGPNCGFGLPPGSPLPASNLPSAWPRHHHLHQLSGVGTWFRSLLRPCRSSAQFSSLPINKDSVSPTQDRPQTPHTCCS